MQRLIEYLTRLPFPNDGRMYGSLTARDNDGQMHELWAFSGAAAGELEQTLFVGLTFDVRLHDPVFVQGEAEVVRLTGEIIRLSSSDAHVLHEQALDGIRRQAKSEITAFKQHIQAQKRRRGQLREQGGCDLAMLERESQNERGELRRLKALWLAREVAAVDALNMAQSELNALVSERATLSATLQRRWFSSYKVRNGKGEERSLLEVFQDAGHDVPPAGTGECAAPKLIAEAFRRGWEPLELNEFWWGPAPQNELRRHGVAYTPCRGRCHPLLHFMLKGTSLALPVEPAEVPCAAKVQYLHEGDGYLVVYKPHGLLSVPGKTVSDSVLERVKKAHPGADGPMIVHRLDQATSGVMVVALNHRCYHHLQHQFLSRTVLKRYCALLDGEVNADHGRIELPLRVDPMDRPRQVVDFKQGKPAVSRWQKRSVASGQTWVDFWPETGRTHQLRVHAAHPEGLNAPIAGDSLYGNHGDRLMLFAEEIHFNDPVTGERVKVVLPTALGLK